MNDSTNYTGALRNPFNPTKPTIWFQLALAAGLLLAAGPVQAVNLLQNPGFEVDRVQTHYSDGLDAFCAANRPNLFTLRQLLERSQRHIERKRCRRPFGDWLLEGVGRLFMMVRTTWRASIKPSAATSGSTYQANGWFYINSGDQPPSANDIMWVQVEFYDSSSNLLSLYKSGNFNINAGLNTWVQLQVTNACDVTQPVSTGDPFFNTYAITGAVSQLVAPAGTASVVYRYCYLQYQSEGGSSYFDDADLEQLTGPLPLAINNLNPQNEIFVAPSNGVSFDVSSPSGHINTNAIHLVLNGTDVSSNLTFTGSSSNWTVFYNGLQSNTAYTVSITATDSFNFTASANTTFQTTWLGVQAPTYIWEAEDWDFTSGMYL